MEKGDLKIFSRIPRLYTERLTLRKITPKDLADVYEYSKDERVTKHLLWYPHQNIKDTKRYLGIITRKYAISDFYEWGIEYNGKMIGTCGFCAFSIDHNKAEVGYVLNSSFHNMGIATEALRRVIRFGFETLKLNRIEARYMVGNDASLRVMQKCSMKEEGIQRRSVYAKGDYRDVGYCAIIAEDYFKRNT